MLDAWAAGDDATVRALAKDVISIREGRDLDSVHTRIDDNSAKIDAVGERVDAVEEGVEEAKSVAMEANVKADVAQSTALAANEVSKQVIQII